MDSNLARVYIILVNWNGASDTIACLESLFRLEYPEYVVIVCDNDSQDDSLAKMKAWASGTISDVVLPAPPLPGMADPPLSFPISVAEYDRQEAEAGGLRHYDNARLILVKTGSNLGFAGANNIGLRFALTRDDFEYAWVLNNDTFVEKHALLSLVERCQQDPGIGICGSSLIFHDRPQTLQARGGARVIRSLALGMVIGREESVGAPFDLRRIEAKMDYVIGASMLVRKDFLKRIGLMGEDYFLYFEEIDWAVRARGLYRLGYASTSLVYHKVGGSIGSNRNAALRSPTADYYFQRGRLRFTSKFYPWLFPVVYLSIFMMMLLRLLRGQRKSAELAYAALCEYKGEYGLRADTSRFI